MTKDARAPGHKLGQPVRQNLLDGAHEDGHSKEAAHQCNTVGGERSEALCADQRHATARNERNKEGVTGIPCRPTSEMNCTGASASPWSIELDWMHLCVGCGIVLGAPAPSPGLSLSE